jgi:hypothetical protein
MYVFVAVLLILVLVFGFASMSQSYATAQQAQAQIETARVAQVSAWGNLVTILTLALVIVVAMALISAVFWVMLKRAHQKAPNNTLRSALASPVTHTEGPMSIREMLELEMLRRMLSTPASPSVPMLVDPEQTSVSTETNEPFHWLR